MGARSVGVTPSSGDAITLTDLRELVEDTAGLPGDAVLRAQPAMRGQDFTHPSGMTLREVTVQFERPTGAQVRGEVTPT